jgi:putative phage-type endonuclease
MFGFSEDDIIDLEIEIHDFVEKYLEKYGIQQCQPDFYKNMVDETTHEFLEDFICNGFVDTAQIPYENLFQKLRKRVNIFAKNYFTIIGIPRRVYCNPRSHNYNSGNREFLKKQIVHLQNIVQPEQRTAEWYRFRHNLITASNIWKSIGSDANKNSLIFEKCKPLVEIMADSPAENVNTSSPLHWGVKYEPLTVMLYEQRNRAKVGNFGCIRHEKYPFIGASPDGIVINEESPAFGRMLEIKNVVSREITGIPKMEYWVQTQVQMEVCDLNECDFLETQFKEYDEVDEDLFYKNKHLYLYNGVILYFINREFTNGNPHYVYMPLSVKLTKKDIHAWVDSQKLALKETHILFKRIYWYCETYSCVLIKRNRVWLEMAIPKIKEIWDTIEKERVSGYDHRKPKKRSEKPVVLNKCLIDDLTRAEVENSVLDN